MLGFGKNSRFQIQPEPHYAIEPATPIPLVFTELATQSCALAVVTSLHLILPANHLQVRAKDHQKPLEPCSPVLTYLFLQNLSEPGLNTTVEKVVKPPAEKHRKKPGLSQSLLQKYVPRKGIL